MGGGEKDESSLSDFSYSDNEGDDDVFSDLETGNIMELGDHDIVGGKRLKSTELEEFEEVIGGGPKEKNWSSINKKGKSTQRKRFKEK